MVSGLSPQELKPEEVAEDLVQLLKTNMFEDFTELYRRTAQGMDNGPVALAELVNDRIRRNIPDCDVTLVVSQQLENNKHLVAINDGSRFFGDSWTVTRNMFLV